MSYFLKHIFDAKEIYASEEKSFSISKERFLLIDGLWFAIMEGKPSGGKNYDHVAFKVPEADFQKYAKRVHSLGVEILEGRCRMDGEGRSIYFYDYDNHLFELHTGTLKQRLETYQGTAPI